MTGSEAAVSVLNSSDEGGAFGWGEVAAGGDFGGAGGAEVSVLGGVMRISYG